MKKLILCLFTCILLLGMVIPAQAAGSAALTGPASIRAGETVTLSFSAGGGIYGGQGLLTFDNTQLQLESWDSSLGSSWDVSFNGNNFVFYDTGLSSPITDPTTVFTVTLRICDAVATDTIVSVKVSGLTLSTGSQDISAGSPSWSASVSAPLSGNYQLATMHVTGAQISPAFSPEETAYTASVPYSTAAVQVSATAADNTAKVTIHNPPLTAGTTTAVSITVTAQNGDTNVYFIHITRGPDPNAAATEATVPSSPENALTAEPLTPSIAPTESTAIPTVTGTEDTPASDDTTEATDLSLGMGILVIAAGMAVAVAAFLLWKKRRKDA